MFDSTNLEAVRLFEQNRDAIFADLIEVYTGMGAPTPAVTRLGKDGGAWIFTYDVDNPSSATKMYIKAQKNGTGQYVIVWQADVI